MQQGDCWRGPQQPAQQGACHQSCPCGGGEPQKHAAPAQPRLFQQRVGAEQPAQAEINQHQGQQQQQLLVGQLALAQGVDGYGKQHQSRPIEAGGNGQGQARAGPAHQLGASIPWATVP